MIENYNFTKDKKTSLDSIKKMYFFIRCVSQYNQVLFFSLCLTIEGAPAKLTANEYELENDLNYNTKHLYFRLSLKVFRESIEICLIKVSAVFSCGNTSLKYILKSIFLFLGILN